MGQEKAHAETLSHSFQLQATWSSHDTDTRTQTATTKQQPQENRMEPNSSRERGRTRERKCYAGQSGVQLRERGLEGH